MTPTLPECEADVWAPVREEGYMCGDCELIEKRMDNADDFLAFRERWNDPVRQLTPEQLDAAMERQRRGYEEDDRAWTWPAEIYPTDRVTRSETLARWRDERTYSVFETIDGESVWKHVSEVPTNVDLLTRILGVPDDDAPRCEYAQWLRQQDHLLAADAADFIEGQVRRASSLRDNPRSGIKAQHSSAALSPTDDSPDQPPGHDVIGALANFTMVLDDEGLIDDRKWYRGFVEHVAIKATRFLEIADELFSLAPIRQLTLTYCKGLDHQDTGLWKALLASPHLQRMRALRFPVRYVENQYTEMNRFTDSDLELLAESKHLRGLADLDLEDQEHLTIGAFHALAASANLPALSHVRHDLYHYGYTIQSSFGGLGERKRALAERPLERYTAELEARHGRIPWLRPVEHYGTDSPDVEAVIEHPIALRGLPPDVGRGPASLAHAIRNNSPFPAKDARSEQERFDAAIELLKTALAARDAGNPTDAIALIERALGLLEGIDDHEVAVRRVRFAITRADIATSASLGERVAYADYALLAARQLGERSVLATALYVAGMAKRDDDIDESVRYIEEGFSLLREIEGDDGPGTVDTAAALGSGYLRMAMWERTIATLDHAIAHDPSPPGAWFFNRAIAHERLGVLPKARTDLERFEPPPPLTGFDRVLARLLSSRIHASAGNETQARAELLVAYRLAEGELPPEDARWALIFEAIAWCLANAVPRQLLASEVAIRRAIERTSNLSVRDTGKRIAAMWRPGDHGRLKDPDFALLKIRATRMTWNGDKLSHEPGDKVRGRFLIAGPSIAIHHLTEDPSWRRTCAERLLSALAGNDRWGELTYDKPVKISARAISPRKALALLPRLDRMPFGSAFETIVINWQGEPLNLERLHLAALAVRKERMSDDEALASIRCALPDESVDCIQRALHESAHLWLKPKSEVPGINGWTQMCGALPP